MAQKSRSQRLNGLFPLSYLGVIPTSPQNFTIQQRPPALNDWRNHYIGDIWLDNSSLYPPPGTPPTGANIWILVSLSGNQGYWINFGGGGSGTLNTLTGNSGGAVSPLAGNINVVGDGTTINVVGNPATHTLTISTVGGVQPGTSCAFLAVQSANVANVTGDGTVYSLGSAQTLTTIFDIGSNVYIGSGIGAPATFTAPATGNYWLDVGIQLTNLLAGVFNDSIGTYSIVTPERTYSAEFSPLGLFTANAMVSDTGTISQGFFVNLTVGDVVTFTVMTNLNLTNGVKDIGVGGSLNPAVTFISGFIVSGGGGGGVVSVSAGNNIVFTGGDPVHNPIINVTPTISLPTTTVGFTAGALQIGGNTVVQTYGTENTFLGPIAGNTTLTVADATGSTGVGYASLVSLSTGNINTALGSFSSRNITTGNGNLSAGSSSLSTLSTGSNNVALGADALIAATTSSNTVAVGSSAGSFVTSGSNNIFLGTSSGSHISSTNSNIIIGNTGTIGDENTIRIGTDGSGAGQQNLTYIAGINGINVGSVASVVSISGDQLGTTTITAGTGVTVTPGVNTITIAASGTSTLTYTAVSTTPYVVLATDDFLGVNSSSASITIKLPNAPVTGRVYIIKDSTGSAATHNITVTTVGGTDDIDGATSYVINANYEAISVLFDGTNWEVF